VRERSTSVVTSSAQQNAPGSSTMPNPGCCFGCQIENAAPTGSVNTANCPASIASVVATSVLPRWAVTSSLVFTASSVLK